MCVPMTPPARHFLGFGPAPLARAADALLERTGAGRELGRALVAVPGARVGRGLAAALRRAAQERGLTAFEPPRIVTQGRLVDALVRVERPTADRAARTFAWEQALAAEPDAGALFERLPARGDRTAWWRLAERLRSLHGELADAERSFEDVAAHLAAGVSEREARRWRILAGIQARWRAVLLQHGLVDPHEARNAALLNGAIETAAPVVLVGIVDPPGLLRRALAPFCALGGDCTALVLAPEAHARGFDAFGALVADYWASVPLDLAPDGSLSRWHVVANPDDEVELTARLVAHRAAGARAHDVTVGVADDAVAPFLERRFAADGVHARAAAGMLLTRTPPARLIEAFGRWLDGGGAASAAALVRHPDLARVLAARLAHDAPLADWAVRQHRGTADEVRLAPDIAALIDRVRAEHVLARLDDSDLPQGVRSEDRGAMRAVLDHLHELAGPLARQTVQPLHTSLDALRELLTEVYSAAPLGETGDPEHDEAARVCREALAALGATLATLQDVPATLLGEATTSAALDLVLAALGAARVPPRPEDPAVPTVELLGWLELPLDPAPHLVVTGFVEGAVPEAPGADPFLPDTLRRALELEDDHHRTARDAYVLATLVATRSVDLVSPRRTRAGDPRFPSRLAFHAPPEEALVRMRRALAPLVLPRASALPAPEVVYRRPQLEPLGVPSFFAVTDFKQYLESPYRYGVQRLLRLADQDDGARELDPRLFGTLLHDAASVLVREELAGSTDEAQLIDALLACLDTLARERFGAEPLPAVAMQIEQARLRLVDLARWQAARAADGWRVLHTEWSPRAIQCGRVERRAVPLELAADAPPAWLTGKIDRIDRHADGRLAILDYKTGAKPVELQKAFSPGSAEKPEVWQDPQLALYCLLAAELIGSRPLLPTLGFVSLTPTGVAPRFAPESWAAEDIIGSVKRLAREVVESVRAGALYDIGRIKHFEPETFADLVGVGFVVPPDSPEEGDDDSANGEGEA